MNETSVVNENTEVFEKKIALIERNLQEITINDKEIIRKIIKKRNLKIYWGTAITGKPHIGYFLPILKIKDFVEAECEVTILFADIHGFLDNLKAPIELIETRYHYYEKIIKAMLMSVGCDINKIRFVKGSEYQKNPDYIFDLYKLCSYTTERDCKRAGSDVVKQRDNVLLSSLIYPNMQALDEEYLKVDAQFGGEDQRKIFMHAKTFLPKLGYKKRVHLMNPMMPGLNSDKMSSSDELSKIDLLDTEQQISKKINKCFCEEGNLQSGVLHVFEFVIFHYYTSVLINEKSYNSIGDVKRDFEMKLIHPKDLKLACSNYINKMVAPIRNEMLKDMDIIKKAYNN